jgi:hypothetical protein
MTDDRPPIDDSDEDLASAYLDGEATAAERARVEADPRLVALVDSYRATAEAVGSRVMPLDQPRRDAMVAAALAVLDDVDDEPDAGSPPAKVVQLSARRRWFSRAPGLAAAAAILFLVGIGLVLSSRGSDRDQSAELSASSEQSTSTDSSASDAAEDGDTGSAAAGDAESDSEALASPTPPVSGLGDFADEDSLRTALAAAPTASTQEREEAPDSGAEEPDRAAPLAREVQRCADVVTTTDTVLDELLAVRTATLAGEPVLIFSHTERDEPDRIVDTVADRASCQIRFAQSR